MYNVNIWASNNLKPNQSLVIVLPYIPRLVSSNLRWFWEKGNRSILATRFPHHQ